MSLDLSDVDSVWDDVDNILALFVPQGLPPALIVPVRDAIRTRLGAGVRATLPDLYEAMPKEHAKNAYDIVRKHLTA